MVADGESDELQDTFVSCDGSPNEQVTFRIGWNVTVAYAVFSGMVQEYGACYGRRILAAYDFYAFSGMRDDIMKRAMNFFVRSCPVPCGRLLWRKYTTFRFLLLTHSINPKAAEVCKSPYLADGMSSIQWKI